MGVKIFMLYSSKTKIFEISSKKYLHFSNFWTNSKQQNSLDSNRKLANSNICSRLIILKSALLNLNYF